MGRRGTKAQAPALKLLKGARKDRVNLSAPAFTEHDGEPPDELSDDARAVWFRTVPELRRHGLLGTVEEAALVCYCEAVVTHRAAVREVREVGITTIGARGGLVRNPACTVEGDMARVIRSFAAEFGLTPAARGHVKSTAGPETDADASDFFDG